MHFLPENQSNGPSMDSSTVLPSPILSHLCCLLQTMHFLSPSGANRASTGRKLGVPSAVLAPVCDLAPEGSSALYGCPLPGGVAPLVILIPQTLIPLNPCTSIRGWWSRGGYQLSAWAILACASLEQADPSCASCFCLPWGHSTYWIAAVTRHTAA